MFRPCKLNSKVSDILTFSKDLWLLCNTGWEFLGNPSDPEMKFSCVRNAYKQVRGMKVGQRTWKPSRKVIRDGYSPAEDISPWTRNTLLAFNSSNLNPPVPWDPLAPVSFYTWVFYPETNNHVFQPFFLYEGWLHTGTRMLSSSGNHFTSPLQENLPKRRTGGSSVRNWEMGRPDQQDRKSLTFFCYNTLPSRCTVGFSGAHNRW